MDASCKKSLSMTSYGGIIRIRLKGRSLMTSSQPANTSSPVLLCLLYSQKQLVARENFKYCLT